MRLALPSALLAAVAVPALLAGCPPPPATGAPDAGLVANIPDAGPFTPPPDGGFDDAGNPIPVDAGPVNTSVTVDALTPPAGPVSGIASNGDALRVIIDGTGFSQNVRVFFDDIEADTPLSLALPTKISVHPNCASPGHKTVTVYDELGVGQLEGGYTCFSPVEVDDPVTPAQGSTEGGEPVAIHGKGFTPDMIVTVGGRQVVGLVVADDGDATFLTPPGVPGRADVTATDAFGRAVKPLAFLYVSPLAIDAVTPNVVDDVNAVVELDGSGYVDAAAATVGAAVAARDNLISEARLRVIVPSGLAGPQDVAVTDGVNSAVLQNGLVIRPATTGAITITAAVPAEADVAGGTAVTLVGEQFTGATALTVGGVNVATFTVADDRTIDFTAPAGVVGAAAIVVTAPAGTATLNNFAYTAPVKVTGVSPANGPASGGTTVTIAGRGFVDPATVTFGGIPADPADVIVVSDTEITVVTPAGAAGSVDVAVSSNGARGVEANAFRYDVPVSVLGVIPSRGGFNGFTFVTITGSGFSKGAASVVFSNGVGNVGGGGPCIETVVVNDSTITCRTPPGAPGLSDVSVTVAVETATANKVYSYFNPASAVGGTRGAPIDGAVYVSAFDAFTGQPVPSLTAFIGTDGHPVRAGMTDSLGMATISGPEVVGPQTVTVAGDCFGSVTFFDVDATELTAFVYPLCGSGTGNGTPPPPPPPALVRGHVFGFAKEFFDPAALDDSGCNQGPPAKCEHAVAEVTTTTPDEFSGNPQLLPDSVPDVFQEGDPFFLDNTRTGQLALVAIAGIFDTNNQTFRLRQLGVRRQVFPLSGHELDDQDIELTIPLDVDIDLSLPDAPIRDQLDTADIGFLPTVTRVVPFLQFGGEGALVYTQAVEGKRNQTLHTMPDVPGELLTFVSGAYTTDGRNVINQGGTVTLNAGDTRVIGSGTNWTLDADLTPGPDVEGNIFVTNRPDGSRFAAIVQSAPDNTTLQLQDPPDFTITTPQAYHVGAAGTPSSEVIQDGVGDMRGGVTIQPVLGLPQILSPLEGGVMTDRTLHWKAAPGQQPSIHDMFIFEPFALASVWEFYVDGLRTKVIVPKIPELDAIERALPSVEAACVADPTVSALCGQIFGLDPTGKKPYVPPEDMARGGMAWQHTASFVPGSPNSGGFSFNNWSLIDIQSLRRSWTTDNHVFVHGDDGGGADQ